MTKKDIANSILELAKKKNEIYHHDLRTCQLALGRKHVNDYVAKNNIKIVIKF